MITKPLKKLYNSGWRVLIILAVLLQASLLPLDFLFDLRSRLWYRVIDFSVTLIFIVDLIENIVRYRKIRKHSSFREVYWDTYSTGQFFIADLLAVLPYAFLFSNPFWQLLRLFKWVKVLRTMRNFQLRNLRPATTISLWILIVATFLFSHLFSCVWIGIHGLESELSNQDNYVRALYYTVTTLTSVGYGDIVPINNLEMLFNIFVQLLGVGLLAFIVGSVVGIITKKNPAEQRFIENMEKLRALIHYHEIPKDLENRISEFFTYEWKQKKGYDETGLMEALPYGLRSELQFVFKKNMIRHIPLFDCVDDHFIREIAHHFSPLVLTPNDYLFLAGDKANSMYFIQRGTIKVLTSDEKNIVTILKPGDFVGEIALFKNTNRTATVKSVGYSDVYELDKKEFEKVLDKYPEIAQKLKEKAISREERYL